MADTRTPIIIDTDPGVDDALAIMVAAASDKVYIKGICPVDGNVPYEYTSTNALKLKEFLGLDCDVPSSTNEQLVKPCPHHSSVHGKSGLGSVELPEPQAKFHELKAWDYIYEAAKECAGELVIVAIGPLTNIARAVEKHPDLKDYVKRIVCMGGSTEKGNVTPYAEFNFWVDGYAAKVVFESGIPIVLAGLNVTLKTGLSFRFVDELVAKAGDSKYAKAIKDFVTSYSDQHVNREGEMASVVHDAIAVMYAIDPEGCTTENAHVEILVDDEHYGQSVATYEGDLSTVIITDVDMRRYEQLYTNAMEYFNKK